MATRVLDGCVLLVDAVSGVQCQTKTVWRKIAGRQLPAVAFVNKMDRVGADLLKTVESIREQLDTNPVLLQLPLLDDDNFEGVIDLISKTVFKWPLTNAKSSSLPPVPTVEMLSTSHSHYEQYEVMRKQLLDSLTEVDDEFMELCLEADFDSLTPKEIVPAIRRATLQRKVLPVFCGAALKGKGIHALLDGVISFLPSPADLSPVVLEKQDTKEKREVNHQQTKELCALAFKVVHDTMKGLLVYTRVFSGTLHSKDSIYNTLNGKAERVHQVLSISGEDFAPLMDAGPGSVCCLIGLKNTKAGDTIVTEGSRLRAYSMQGMTIPKPVFSLAVEPESAAKQKDLEAALKILALEDPSLQVDIEEESGQLVLRGLGELHLEIVCDKLRRQHRVQVYTGKTYIGYRETLKAETEGLSIHAVYDRVIEGKRLFAQFDLAFKYVGGTGDATFSIDEKLKSSLTADEYSALVDSLRNSLTRGPKGYPVVGIDITVKSCGMDGAQSTPGAIRACISTNIAHTLASTQYQQLLEPIMMLEIEVPDKFVGDVVSELSAKRRAQELEIRNVGASNSIVIAKVPLQAILGYATSLRSMTQGEGVFTAEYCNHTPVNMSDVAL